MEKGREANENILMEEKPHGMRKVRVMNARAKIQKNKLTQWEGGESIAGKKSNSFAFSIRDGLALKCDQKTI